MPRPGIEPGYPGLRSGRRALFKGAIRTAYLTAIRNLLSTLLRKQIATTCHYIDRGCNDLICCR
jgi:hypothetical protein